MQVAVILVSIHAAHTGSDGFWRLIRRLLPLFLFTPPVRVATLETPFLFTLPVRAATTLKEPHIHLVIFLFTPPAQVATPDEVNLLRECIFLFTPPLRAATTATQKLQAAGGVSIHATRAGSDERKDMPVSRRQVFLCSEHLRSAQDPICLYRSNAVNAVQYVLLYASCTGRQLCFAATQQKSLTFLAA